MQRTGITQKYGVLYTIILVYSTRDRGNAVKDSKDVMKVMFHRQLSDQRIFCRANSRDFKTPLPCFEHLGMAKALCNISCIILYTNIHSKELRWLSQVFIANTLARPHPILTFSGPRCRPIVPRHPQRYGIFNGSGLSTLLLFHLNYTFASKEG